MQKYYLPILIVLIGTVIFSCSGNDYQPPAPSFWFQLEEIEKAYQEDYSFVDFNIKIYKNRSDWVSEKNPLFSGRFDETGEIRITNTFLKARTKYYIEVHTDDNVLSNWITGINIQIEDQNIEETNESHSIPIDIRLNNYKKAIGRWESLETDFISGSKGEFKPLEVIVKKDFTVQLIDSLANGTKRTTNYSLCSSRVSSTRSEYSNFSLVWEENEVIQSCKYAGVSLSYRNYPGELISIKHLFLGILDIKYFKK